MVNHNEFEQLVGRANQSLQRATESIQVAQTEIANARKALAALAGHSEPTTAAPLPAQLVRVAVANGRTLPLDQLRAKDISRYDVVLNCVDRVLLSKDRPGTRCSLEPRSCEGLGPHRMKLLRYMLEHPDRPVCMHDLNLVYGEVPVVTDAALVKTMSFFRSCLGEPAYILTVHDYGGSNDGTGYVYTMNQAYRYLVIRYRI
jgi:hypothetical protein